MKEKFSRLIFDFYNSKENTGFFGNKFKLDVFDVQFLIYLLKSGWNEDLYCSISKRMKNYYLHRKNSHKPIWICLRDDKSVKQRGKKDEKINNL